jgi:hypothetical protein
MVIISSAVSHQTPAAALQLQRSEYLVKKIFGGVEVRGLARGARLPCPRTLPPFLTRTHSHSPHLGQDKPETLKADSKAAQSAREAEGEVDGEHLRHRTAMPADMLEG